jgi:mono/diheme cytochrome c family protein
VTEFPFASADEKMMALGKLKYETNCAVCHGFAGNGDGLVSQRALQLAQGYWVQPTSLHEPRVQKQPVGKIFHTITNGRGKMGAYGPVLNAKERWAIVLYVKALQLSRDAKEEDVPESQRAKLTATPAK